MFGKKFYTSSDTIIVFSVCFICLSSLLLLFGSELLSLAKIRLPLSLFLAIKSISDMRNIKYEINAEDHF